MQDQDRHNGQVPQAGRPQSTCVRRVTAAQLQDVASAFATFRPVYRLFRFDGVGALSGRAVVVGASLRPGHLHPHLGRADIGDLREPAGLAAFPSDHKPRVRSWGIVRPGHPAVPPGRRRWRWNRVLHALPLRPSHLDQYACPSNKRSGEDRCLATSGSGVN